jgi:hypothetical protein
MTDTKAPRIVCTWTQMLVLNEAPLPKPLCTKPEATTHPVASPLDSQRIPYTRHGSCYETQYNYPPGNTFIVISNTFCTQGPVVVIKTNTTTPRLTLSQGFTTVLGWVFG